MKLFDLADLIQPCLLLHFHNLKVLVSIVGFEQEIFTATEMDQIHSKLWVEETQTYIILGTKKNMFVQKLCLYKAKRFLIKLRTFMLEKKTKKLDLVI